MAKHSILEKFKVSTEKSGDTWFGCVIDSQGRLVTSAFGTELDTVRGHLFDYSRKLTGSEPVLDVDRLTHEMVRLFEGQSIRKTVAFNTEFISDFQHRVCKELERIPEGRVTTYGLISRRLHSSPRAVGGAVGSNPWPLFVPCQRVVNFDLSTGNYSMCGSLDRVGALTKRALLGREGVPIRSGVADRTVLWDPSENKS